MPPSYTVAFDVALSPTRDLWFPAFGLVFMAAGAVVVLLRKRFGGRFGQIFPFVFLGFASLWTVGSTILVLGSTAGLAADLREGRCSVVEGVVTSFEPMPLNGKGEESFKVKGARFHYSEYSITPGFRQTSASGGPIRDGLPVRIHYKGNDIARLEVAQ